MFFFMLYVLGVGSSVSVYAAIITIFTDQFPGLKYWKAAVVTSVFGFLLGLLYITPVIGSYLFQKLYTQNDFSFNEIIRPLKLFSLWTFRVENSCWTWWIISRFHLIFSFSLLLRSSDYAGFTVRNFRKRSPGTPVIRLTLLLLTIAERSVAVYFKPGWYQHHYCFEKFPIKFDRVSKIPADDLKTNLSSRRQFQQQNSAELVTQTSSFFFNFC